MKNDARFLLNKKKWNNTQSKNKGSFAKNRWAATQPRARTIDARAILDSKRSKVSKISPKQFIPKFQTRKNEGNKKVQLMKDGNLFITSSGPKTNETVTQIPTSYPRKMVDVTLLSKSRPKAGSSNSPEDDDLERMGLEDLMDLEDLPSTVMPQPQRTQVVRSGGFQVPEHSMVADRISLAPDTRPRGGRVYVTNLSPTVSRQDLTELFVDVGPVLEVSMQEPGSAVVSFMDRKDAMRACDIYHSRLLDDQPMGCFLQSDDAPQKYASYDKPQELMSHGKRTPILSNANSRSRHDPRNVQFFVRV